MLQCSAIAQYCSTLKTRILTLFLRTLANIFDPLGFLAPVTLIAKTLIQEIWRKKYDWDEIYQVHFKNIGGSGRTLSRIIRLIFSAA